MNNETLEYYKENFITEIHKCFMKCKNKKDYTSHKVVYKNANYTDLICLGCNHEKKVMSEKWIKENLL